MRMMQGEWDWGNVPDDLDVRVASRVMRAAGEGAPKKRRHHYISTTYMDGFLPARRPRLGLSAGRPSALSPEPP